jgi:hypothetical protein
LIESNVCTYDFKGAEWENVATGERERSRGWEAENGNGKLSGSGDEVLSRVGVDSGTEQEEVSATAKKKRGKKRRKVNAPSRQLVRCEVNVALAEFGRLSDATPERDLVDAPAVHLVVGARSGLEGGVDGTGGDGVEASRVKCSQFCFPARDKGMDAEEHYVTVVQETIVVRSERGGRNHKMTTRKPAPPCAPTPPKLPPLPLQHAPTQIPPPHLAAPPKRDLCLEAYVLKLA